MSETKQTLFLMLGYPGAGKSTTALVLQEVTGAALICADVERHKMFENPIRDVHESEVLYGVLNQRAEDFLAGGKSVIYDTNFNYYKDRQRLRELAEKFNALTQLVWVQAPKELARKRAVLEASGEGTRFFGNMPEHQFERLSGNLEEPHDDEMYIAVDGTKVTPDYIRSLLNDVQ